VGLLEDVAVLLCRRRGAAIDLVLNPGARIPRGRSAGSLTIAVDTPEKYGWKFADRALVIERRTLAAGDYAAIVGEAVVAAIERKTLENLATSLSDGSLAFQLQRLAELPKAALVVEGDYPDLFRTQAGPWFLAGGHAGSAGRPLPRGPSDLCRLAQVRRGVGLSLPVRCGSCSQRVFLGNLG